MRIAYVNPTFLIRRPIADLVEKMSPKHEITVLIPKKLFRKPEGKWHSDKSLNKAKIVTYNSIGLPGNFEWPIPFSISLFFDLHKIFKKNDVVHVWTYFYISFWMIKLYSLFYKTKVIVSCDTFPGYSFKSGKVLDKIFVIYTKLFSRILFSGKVHLYTKEMVPYAKKAGVRNYEVITTGIDLKKFDVEGFDFRYKRPIIFYAGLIVPRKGIDVIFRIADKVDGTFVLAGEGPEYNTYKEKAKRNMIFLGWRKDIPSLLKGCDIVILPSKGEGLPGIVMEGMAAGKPIVASDIMGNRELIKDNGFLCRSDKDYISAIKAAYSRRKYLGGKSKEIIKYYSWDKLIPRYERMYASLDGQDL